MSNSRSLKHDVKFDQHQHGCSSVFCWRAIKSCHGRRDAPCSHKKREIELLISRVDKSGAVGVINDRHHSQIISCDMCPFPSWAGGRDHLSSWLIKRALWVSVSQQTFVTRQGHSKKRQGWGVMSDLTAGCRNCVWEANNIAVILSPMRFLHEA